MKFLVIVDSNSLGGGAFPAMSWENILQMRTVLLAFNALYKYRPRSTHQATFAHNYCVELSNARINRFSDGFFPSTSHLWNCLPSAVFPASFNLPSFKRQVYHHLRDQMAGFFFLLLFLDILQNCFILYITLLFLFSRHADSRKGTLCLFCVPIHKKKKKKMVKQFH